MKKRSIRLLLSALLVLVMAFQSFAAPLSYAGPTAASEPAKITGTWSTDASGSWRFNAPDGAAKDGWYYLNTTNNATDYNWFCFDANGVMRTGWVQDKNDPSVWYYTGESKDSSEGGLVKGWITDPQDGKKYYLDPSTGIMCHGWKQVSGVWYYFGESRYSDRKWAPDTTGYWKAGASGKHSYGSLYMNEYTPDGYYVGANGVWVQNHSEDDNSDKPDPIPEYSITVESDGNGTASAGAQKSAAGKEITLTAVPNEGYQFKEWVVESGGVAITENKFTMPAENVAVKAVFEAIAPTEYTVTFDLNGITGTAPEAQTIKYGGKVNKPADPTADGYTFGGWYKEATCTNAWDFANDTVTANTTLYAKWMPLDISSYTMKKGTEWFSAFSGTPADKTKITDITFCKELPQGVSAENPVNLTDRENGKVKGYIVQDGANYKIYIVGDYIFGNVDCSQMFYGFKNLNNLDLSNFDTSKVTNMYCMFSWCSSLTSIAFVEGFDTSEVTDMSGMFGRCSSLTSITFGEGFDTAKVTTMLQMFNSCSALESLDLSKFNTASVTTMKQMFGSCSDLTSITFGDKFNAEKVTDMFSMFSSCSELTSLDLSKFNSKSAQNMNTMFQNCTKLSEITFGTNFNTASVTTMEKMFNNCTALTTLDLSSFNTVNVSNMNSMFFGCSALTSLNLSNFNTGNVTNMGGMFKGCSALTSLDLSNFNTENVANTGSMFENCSKLTSVKIINENKKIKDALGEDWTYDGDTKAYVRSLSLLKASGTSSDLVNDAPMAETEVSEPTAEVFEPEFEPEKFEEANPEELIGPVEAVTEEAAS